MTDPAIQIAETLQTASINRNPSPTHDINPSTAAFKKQPVTTTPIQYIPVSSSYDDSVSLSSDIVDPSRTIRPIPRRAPLPPLPDLRFEQSYLRSLQGADSWGRIAWITIRDQVLFPLIQGTLWTLALSGWRYWNRGAQFSGRTVGVKIRRWWWQVNNWKIPEA
ncbi:hypothetical protein AJ80_02525 [Polytolypa hystricis UAMH7299]|uniref:DUF1770 domain-containing protein n=1 Tax=Polytolypa hystricis (strain UAMH7299) TaxID=1447883 RepID=A0A2B7YQ48_POLH7|nr:hypothetical protein AJ80_02525 [Polytolypa hystricis UAMH7299]